jgi:hypothetical protein
VAGCIDDSHRRGVVASGLYHLRGPRNGLRTPPLAGPPGLARGGFRRAA